MRRTFSFIRTAEVVMVVVVNSRQLAEQSPTKLRCRTSPVPAQCFFFFQHIVFHVSSNRFAPNQVTATKPVKMIQAIFLKPQVVITETLSCYCNGFFTNKTLVPGFVIRGVDVVFD